MLNLPIESFDVFVLQVIEPAVPFYDKLLSTPFQPQTEERSTGLHERAHLGETIRKIVCPATKQ